MTLLAGQVSDPGLLVYLDRDRVLVVAEDAFERSSQWLALGEISVRRVGRVSILLTFFGPCTFRELFLREDQHAQTSILASAHLLPIVSSVWLSGQNR